MYTDRELASARKDYADAFFTQTAQVIRCTRSTDTGGGQVEAWATAAAYPCRVTSAKRDRRREEGETLVGTIRRGVELPFDADIRKSDRLIVGGVTFQVIGSDADRAEALCLTVDLQGT